MEASLRLSHGCRPLCGDAVGDGESDWSWTVARKRRSAQTRTPAEGRSSLILIAADPHYGTTRQRPTPTSFAVRGPRNSPGEFACIPSRELTARLLSLHTCVPLERGSSMTNTAGIPGDRICSFIERVERIDEEIKALNEGKKEVFAEAKGEGFDVKVLREILRLRKQDKDERDEQESLLDLYLRAMESAGSSQAKAA